MGIAPKLLMKITEKCTTEKNSDVIIIHMTSLFIGIIKKQTFYVFISYHV